MQGSRPCRRQSVAHARPRRANRWRAAYFMLAAVLVVAWLSTTTGSVGATPVGVPEGCGSGPAGDGQVYLGAWIPGALDDPRAGRGSDPLGQFESRAGKGVSILQRWEHWGLG